MKKQNIRNIIITSSLFLLFIIFTILCKTIDIQPLGANSTNIGFAKFNTSIHDKITSDDIWDKIGDIFMILSIVVVCILLIIGLIQAIRRKNIFKIDKQIICAGIIFAILIVFYLLFELLVINYRPILIDNALEASYPSTHALLVCVVMSITIILSHIYFKKKTYKTLIDLFSSVSILTTCISRLLSGMHWITDIIGAILLSASLVSLYITIIKFNYTKNKNLTENTDNKTHDNNENQ